MSARKLRVGVVMDPIESIKPVKDSSFAMLLEAGRRDAEIHYMLQADLKMLAGDALAHSTLLEVRDDESDWFSRISAGQRAASNGPDSARHSDAPGTARAYFTAVDVWLVGAGNAAVDRAGFAGITIQFA